MFKKLRDLDKDMLRSLDLPIRGLWQRGGGVDPEHLTAYDPQVVNCMLWKHDVCALSPPNQRFVGVSLHLDKSYRHWRQMYRRERLCVRFLLEPRSSSRSVPVSLTDGAGGSSGASQSGPAVDVATSAGG
eukprot:4698210-Pyramimonas_sp.AAC.1